jgi:hypothetical protein
MDKEKDVEQTIEYSNARFYKAFESLSIENMEEVWKHSDDTICIHPGWEMFTSWTAIRIIIYSILISHIFTPIIYFHQDRLTGWES